MPQLRLLRRLVPVALVALLSLSGLPAGAQVINEFVGNHTGPDLYEFVEVFGAPSTDYSNLTAVQIEGDVGADAGIVKSAYPVGITDAEGLWVSGFVTDDFDHDDSYTILLVDGWSGTVGADLDAGDDGVLDSTPWTSVLDSVGVIDGDAGDLHYLADTVLGPNFDGNSFSPGGASRIPNGSDTDSVADWTRNDWQGAGLPGLAGGLEPGEAVNTPGAINSTSLPPGLTPMLHEFIADHVGADDHELIEVWGDAQADYSGTSILAVDETGQVDRVFAVGTTDAQGFWTTGLLTDQLLDDTLTLLLVETWSGSVGADLDTNDDGTFDLTPWAQIYDSVAVRHGAGELTYSASVLDAGHGGQAGAVGGASRFPNFVDTDAASDWLRNDFDGEGLPGFVGTLVEGEAENTPGAVNLPQEDTYFAAVDTSSSAALRSSLHGAIQDHLRFPYSAGTLDTWDILELADEDPNDASRVLTVYKNSTEAKFGGGSGPYNREHTWPRTFGFPDEGSSYPYTDCHHLMLSDPTYNSDRGSRAFGDCNAGCTERVTDVNNGQGGGSGVYPGNSNWFTAPDGGNGTWEVWHHRRGDIARAMLYMDVRYEGGVHGISGLAEPDLVLTDNTGLITSSGGNTSGTAYMGRLAVLLAWHAADPVDDGERLRNEVIYRFQGNRNPFVDHPEWAGCLFQDLGCGEPPLFADDFETGGFGAWSTVFPAP
ncbi:MAG: endonuclease [Acidobacteriota bacterium]